MDKLEFREIREEERLLVCFLLVKCGMSEKEFPVSGMVNDYEGGVMGSINFAGSDPGLYQGDLIQAEYTDADGTEVIITLTVDTHGKLLDLDFWKTDFSKLIRYPTPETLGLLRLP